jgi:hypothetical protein
MTVGDLMQKLSGLDPSMPVLMPMAEHACLTGEYCDASQADVEDVWNNGWGYLKTQCAGDAKPALVIE